MKPRRLFSGIFLVSLPIAAAWPWASEAQTRDGVTPANEGVCDALKVDGVTPGLYGLCIAYCEALDCPDPRVGPDKLSQCRASSPTILQTYNRRKTSADPAMPCVQPAPCPCWSEAEIHAIGITYTPDVVDYNQYNFPTSYSTFSLVENRVLTEDNPYGAYQVASVYLSSVKLLS